MAERRTLAAVLALACALVTAGCTGVPEAGAVHRTQAAQGGKGVADYPQQEAPGPAAKASQASIIEGMLTAMSAGDTADAQLFMTTDFGNSWTPSNQALIFSFKTAPTAVVRTHDTQWSMTFQQTAIIDGSSSYRRAAGPVTVTFGLQQVAGGEWRVSSISPTPAGTFILAQSLAQVLTPKTLYFPSRMVGPSGVPRLVPDTVFLPRRNTDPAALVQQLLQSGPTQWLAPAVSVTTPASVQVASVVTDSSGLTTVNLQRLGPVSPQSVRTLEAQVAYTLNDAQPLVGSQFQILSNDRALGPPYTLNQVADGYNPDVLTSDAPFYFVRKDQLIKQTSTTQVAPSVAGATLAPEPPTPVIAHLGGVGQIAVSAVVAESSGSATQAVAGVLTGSGTATLEVGAIPSTLANPWTAIPMPGAKRLSTPSFDAVGRSLWTVATTATGATQVYRIPFGVGVPIGPPEPVTVTNALGKPLESVTVVRLSRDGARAALVAKGQAYVGVVALRSTATGDVWTINEARPVITPDTTSDDVDVFWADKARVGVVVRTGDPKTQVPSTKLETVPADGYDTTGPGTASTDGEVTGQVAGPPSGAVQFAGGPQLLWLVSYQGQLERQPAPSSTDDLNPELPWDPLGEGTWPTYAG